MKVKERDIVYYQQEDSLKKINGQGYPLLCNDSLTKVKCKRKKTFSTISERVD